MAKLREKYAPPRHLVLTIYGDDWTMAARKFTELFAPER